mgnify:CR=1 FL=1
MQKVMDQYHDLDTDTEEGKWEYGKAWVRCRFASVLRYFGEYELANLVLNDPAATNMRIKDGLIRFFKDTGPMDDEFFMKVLL